MINNSEDLKDAYIAGLYDGKPYVSGEQPGPGVVKLNTNENPYPPAPGVLRALADFDGRRLRLYPKSDGGDLREAIAVSHGVPLGNVFVGNGSDEVLALAFRACFGFGTNSPVLFPDISYSFFPVWCEFFGIPYETVPVEEDFHLSKESFIRPNGGIVICQPNAPTSIAEGEGFINELIENNGGKSVIIVDEAYADFCDQSSIPRTTDVPNLLITRSFSKGRSLAGQRIGYAIGDPRLINALMAAKDSFNSYPIDILTATLGRVALEDHDYYETVIAKIKDTRGKTVDRLRDLGFDVTEPAANFVFAGCGSAARAQAIYAFLQVGNVYVRYFDKPKIDDHLRISIGKPEDMDAFFERLEEYLAL